jgi:hypothetical protein
MRWRRAIGPPTATARPSSTPEIALTPAPIQSPPADFTPQPSVVLPVIEGVLMTNAQGDDWLQTDDGAIYGIAGITDDVEARIAALADGQTLVRVSGTLVQPVDDVGNKQIRVSRIERAAP